MPAAVACNRRPKMPRPGTRARSPSPELEDELSEVPSVYEEDFELSNLSEVQDNNNDTFAS